MAKELYRKILDRMKLYSDEEVEEVLKKGGVLCELGLVQKKWILTPEQERIKILDHLSELGQEYGLYDD